MSTQNPQHFSKDDRDRINYLINEGCRVNSEIDLLKDGLKEAVDEVSKELDIPKKDLNKAIRMAHKQSYYDEKAQLDHIHELLSISNRA